MKKLATIYQRPGSEIYIACFKDQKRKRVARSTDCTDADAAQQKADRLALEARVKGDAGPESEMADETRRTIDKHLADYQAKLKTEGDTADHIAHTLDRIRAICTLAKIKTAGDISADRINRAAVKLAECGLPSKRKGQNQKPFAPNTVRGYLTAIKSLTRWLVTHDKLARDPLASVCKTDANANKKTERRMLLPDEWQWLKSVTLADNLDRRGITANERVLLYATAVQTGLRSAELRSLTHARLFLDGQQPYITCKARSTKNKRDARQYVQPEIATELMALIATKMPQAAVFAMPHSTSLAPMIRDDLAVARTAWVKSAKGADERQRREQSDFLQVKNHDGQILDFHSLRHTCGAWLAMSGANPKDVQTVMRHSTITLTMDTYGHIFPGSEVATVARFPAMLGTPPVELKATGTEGRSAARAD